MKSRKKNLQSHKKGDMSIQMIVYIVIGLAILLISIYLIVDKGRTAGKAGGCDGDTKMCVESADKCPADTEYSFRPCKTDKVKNGRCCIKL